MVKNNLKKSILTVFFIVVLRISTYFHFIGNQILYLANFKISENIIHLFLSIPLIACLISFARHFIGLNITSFYLPIFLSISIFYLGFTPTLIFLLVTLLLITVPRLILKNYHLHNSSKVSLTLGFTSIIFLTILPLFLELNIFSFQGFFAFVPILLFLIIFMDKFNNMQTKFNLKTEFLSVIKNLILTLIIVILIGGRIEIGALKIEANLIKELIMNYPDLTFLFAFIANLLIGQYTGLRLDELIRFRALILKSNK